MLPFVLMRIMSKMVPPILQSYLALTQLNEHNFLINKVNKQLYVIKW